MTTQQFLKGLLMALVAVLVTAFTTPPVNYLLMAISAVSAILVYSGKNLLAVLHSDSPVGALSLINIASGLLIALGTGFIDGLAMYFIDGVIVWAVLWKYVVFVTLSYLTSTLFAPPYNTTTVKGLVK
jgi:hypothetical protein